MSKISIFFQKVLFVFFLKSGQYIWKYTIFHQDHWKRCYGVSFTDVPDFIKKVKEDMENVEDLEKELEK